MWHFIYVLSQWWGSEGEPYVPPDVTPIRWNPTIRAAVTFAPTIAPTVRFAPTISPN